MNRFVLALVPLAMLTAVGWADRELTPEQLRAQQIERNSGLIAALVDRGLGLAAEEDPAKRTDQLGLLARTVASEIQTAAKQSDSGRVDELGTHLDTILNKGLVESLDRLREQAPPGSSLAQQLEGVKAHTAGALKQLQDELRTSKSNPTVRDALKKVVQKANDGHNVVVDRAGKATAAQR